MAIKDKCLFKGLSCPFPLIQPTHKRLQIDWILWIQNWNRIIGTSEWYIGFGVLGSCYKIRFNLPLCESVDSVSHFISARENNDYSLMFL